MIRVFISQPMDELSDEQIYKIRAEAERSVRKKFGRDLSVFVFGSPPKTEGYAPSDVKNSPLWYLGVSIEMLADADVAYFVDGWKNARECIMEHEACKLYGIDIIKD